MKRKTPPGQVRGRREKGGTSQVEGVQFEFKKSFSPAKDVKLSKTRRSYTVKTEVNLCLAGNPFIPSSVLKIVMSVLSLKKNITLTFWKPGVVIFALSNVLRWLNTDLH